MFLLSLMLPGCLTPVDVQTELQGIHNDVSKLESLVEQKADNNVVAECIDEINNKIEQTTQIAEDIAVWRKEIQADTIIYNGAGYVIAVVIVFLVAGLLLVKAFLKRGNMLTFLTHTIKQLGNKSPDVVRLIKEHLRKNVADESSCFTEQHRKDLGDFTRKHGTFAKPNDPPTV